jgi:hypothetical protein
MAKAEHPEKYSWWLNELDSLGISTLQKNGLDNQKEASDLAEAVKQRHFMKSIYKPIVKVTDSSYLDQKQIKKLAEHIQAFLVAETKARR